MNAFKYALTKVFNTHSLLSGFISIKDGSPFFNIPSTININNYFEIKHLNVEFSNNAFKKFILNEVHRKFKLGEDLLTKIRFISFSDSSYIIFVFHHIIIDHHSKSIFLNDISKHYSSFINDTSIISKYSIASYESYILYEEQMLTSEKADKMRIDWKSALKKYNLQIDLPFDRNSETIFQSHGKRLHFRLDKEVSNEIDKFAADNHINPFVFLLSTYALFLSRIGEQTNFAIGVPFSNRRHEDFKNTFGCFVNIIPLILSLDNNLTFTNLIKQVRTELLKNHRRQEIPLVELQAIYNENYKGYPFHVGFTFEGPVDFTLENIDIQAQNIEREGTQLELFLTMWPSHSGYQGFWEFNTDKFKDSTVYRFIAVFKTIIQGVLESPNKQYLDYHVLPDSDKKLIENINNTTCIYNDKICIHQVFEKKVFENPERLALIENSIELSYNELNIHANRLANYLIENDTQVGDIIAIACERRAEMIISILAVLKSGAAYLPIQINNPPEVIDEIINNANPKYILASSFGGINIYNKRKIISIEDIIQNPYTENNRNPDINVNSNNLAYIIFTSGSTGVPKGVAIKHHSVINRIEWMQKSYPLSEKDVVMQKTPITFDVSVWELFWWFFGGAKLLLLDHDGEKNPILIIDAINKNSVSKIHFVPSMLVLFIDILEKRKLTDQVKSLQTIFCSGESLPPSLVKKFNDLKSASPLAKIVNLYGPTEATIDVSYYNCPDFISDTDKIFIGRPIDNTELFIVNNRLNIQPIGIKGELLITGINLAVGYLNNKELTSKHFVKFIKPNGKQVTAYKTGDLARLNANGEIEYIGRKDNQVKIRGIRIELGEIEAKLTRHPKISTAAVSLINEQENKTFIAYIVLLETNSISERKLLNDLKKILPPIMMPSQIMFMDNLPFTVSGKIDRRKLPKPHEPIINNEMHTRPETFYENKLFDLWSNLLLTQNIEVTDNFFDVGGNSLLAIKLSMLIATTFSIEPDVISIMEYPTIKDYALYLDNRIKDNSSNTIKENINRSEKKRLRFNQTRLSKR